MLQCFKATTDLEGGEGRTTAGKSQRSASCSTGTRVGLQRSDPALTNRIHALPAEQERHNDRKPAWGKNGSALLPNREPRG